MRNLPISILASFVFIMSAVAYADGSRGGTFGVELGNGRSIGDYGGLELGNGRFTNTDGNYRFRELLGKWEVNPFRSFTELISVRGFEGLRTRAQINVIRMETIFSARDLVDFGNSLGWTPYNIGNLAGIRHEPATQSGVRQVEYRFFQNPTEIIQVNVTGSPSGQDGGSFDDFQRSLGSFELVKGQ